MLGCPEVCASLSTDKLFYISDLTFDGIVLYINKSTSASKITVDSAKLR